MSRFGRQSEEYGSKIVTVPHEILGKAIKLCDIDLGKLSLDTVRMFAEDAAEAGFSH